MSPAFSGHLVQELLKDYSNNSVVLDPFVGTGTTVLTATQRGHRAIGVDINPFLVWLARAKVARYSESVIGEAKDLAETLRVRLAKRRLPLAEAPPIRNRERWWGDKELEYLRRIKGGLDDLTCTRKARTLLSVAFCRTVIDLAKVSRAHQSLSYNSGAQFSFGFERGQYWNSVDFVLSTAKENPGSTGRIFHDDARSLRQLASESADVVITSPPYPNRVTTLRELRPFMYWLGYIGDHSEVGELDWSAIGGTWGVATRRLARWECPQGSQMPAVIRHTCRKIGDEKVESARLMANYVARYFVDMLSHLQSIYLKIRPGGRINYVVGNSSFYGHLVETEKAFVELFELAGFVNNKAVTLRKRSSGPQLFEFLVSGQKEDHRTSNSRASD